MIDAAPPNWGALPLQMAALLTAAARGRFAIATGHRREERDRNIEAKIRQFQTPGRAADLTLMALDKIG